MASADRVQRVGEQLRQVEAELVKRGQIRVRSEVGGGPAQVAKILQPFIEACWLGLTLHFWQRQRLLAFSSPCRRAERLVTPDGLVVRCRSKASCVIRQKALTAAASLSQ
jgi:hypothetical protein